MAIILLVDPSQTIRRIVEMAFKASGHDVVAAASAGEGSQAISRYDPAAVLVNYLLPDDSGLELCRNLKSDPTTSWLPLIVLGGHYAAFDVEEARQWGADAVLMKPFKTDTLLDTVHSLIVATQGEAVASPHGAPQAFAQAGTRPTPAPPPQAPPPPPPGRTPPPVPAGYSAPVIAPAPAPAPAQTAGSGRYPIPPPPPQTGPRVSARGMPPPPPAAALRGPKATPAALPAAPDTQALRAVVRELLPSMIRDALQQILRGGLESRLQQYLRERVDVAVKQNIRQVARIVVREEIDRLRGL